jgi:hypothetical protein
MIAEGLANGTTSPPTREHIVAWTQTAMHGGMASIFGFHQLLFLTVKLSTTRRKVVKMRTVLPAVQITSEQEKVEYTTRHKECDRFTTLCLGF